MPGWHRAADRSHWHVDDHAHFVCAAQRSWTAGIDDPDFWNPKPQESLDASGRPGQRGPTALPSSWVQQAGRRKNSPGPFAAGPRENCTLWRRVCPKTLTLGTDGTAGLPSNFVRRTDEGRRPGPTPTVTNVSAGAHRGVELLSNPLCSGIVPSTAKELTDAEELIPTDEKAPD